MKGKLCCFVIALQVMSWATVSSRPFPPNHGLGLGGEGQSPKSVELTISAKGVKSNKIGSSPPICENKCYGCNPCEAIQVPATSTRHNHFGVLYANYEPEGWKCKCGPSFYTP